MESANTSSLEGACGDVEPKPERRSSAELDELIFRVIATTEVPIGAYSIAKELRGRGEQIVINQIYRVLRRLLEVGRISRIECLSAFVVATPETNMLTCVCRECQMVKQIALGDLGILLSKVSAEHRIDQSRLVIEAVGLCETCAANMSSAKRQNI